MVFKKEEDYNISEIGNWNVASDYAKLKIMKPLDFSDHYENIARFGYDSIIEQIENYNIPTDDLKILGFERLINELIKLCNNSMFAMKKGDSKNKLFEYKTKLEEIRKMIPLLYKIIKKRNGSILKIKKEKYERILNLVLEIKSKINEPLNINDLIFTSKEEFDPHAYKLKIMEDAKIRG